MTTQDRIRVAERIAGHIFAMHVAGGALLMLMVAIHVDAVTGGRLRR